MAQPTPNTAAPQPQQQQQPLRFTTADEYISNVEISTGWLPLDAHMAALKTALSVYNPGPEDLHDGVLPPLDKIKVSWSKCKVDGVLARAVITITRPADVCVSQKRTRIIIKSYRVGKNSTCPRARQPEQRERMRSVSVITMTSHDCTPPSEAQPFCGL